MFDSQFKKVLDTLNKRLFSSTYQIQRLVILLAFVLVGVLVMFGGYYYVDRYYSGQQTQPQMNIAEAEKAVSDDPQNPEARVILAETYMLYGRLDDALSQAISVYDTYPENQRAWVALGVTQALKDNCPAAIEPLEKYVEANKDMEMAALNAHLRSAAYYLGDCYLKTGQQQKAVNILELSVGWNRTDADSLYKLGLAYSLTGQPDKAIYVLISATTFVPDFAEAYQAMASIYESAGEPDLVNYANGMIAYSQKDYATALDLLLAASQAKPEFTPAFTGLGLTYEAMTDLQNAKAAYQKAADLDPSNFTANNGLQRVTALLNK